MRIDRPPLITPSPLCPTDISRPLPHSRPGDGVPASHGGGSLLKGLDGWGSGRAQRAAADRSTLPAGRLCLRCWEQASSSISARCPIHQAWRCSPASPAGGRTWGTNRDASTQNDCNRISGPGAQAALGSHDASPSPQRYQGQEGRGGRVATLQSCRRGRWSGVQHGVPGRVRSGQPPATPCLSFPSATPASQAAVGAQSEGTGLCDRPGPWQLLHKWRPAWLRCTSRPSADVTLMRSTGNAGGGRGAPRAARAHAPRPRAPPGGALQTGARVRASCHARQADARVGSPRRRPGAPQQTLQDRRTARTAGRQSRIVNTARPRPGRHHRLV